MTFRKYGWLALLASLAARPLFAAEIVGKVRDVGGDAATVVIDGDALPAVGDTVEIFFELGGEDISVASAKVAAVDGKTVKIEIESTTGTVAADHLARFKSSSVAKPPGRSPASPSPPSVPTATGSGIAGDWVYNKDGENLSLSFKADGSLLWVVENAQYGMSTLGKYRTDPSTKPQGIELFDFEEGEMKGANLRGIFEFQGDGRLKLDFVENQQESLKEFSKDTRVFSTATSPVVRSNKPARSIQADEALVEEGRKRYNSGDDAGAMEVLEKAIALNPKNAEAFFYRGQVFSRKNDRKAAIADYEKSNELKPSKEMRETIDASKAVLQNEEQTNRPDEALVREGIKRYESGDDVGAIELLEKAIALNPKNARAFLYRGMCFHHMRDFKAAVADYEKAQELDPSQQLEGLIKSTKVVLKNEEEAKPPVSPARSRVKPKSKP